MIDLTTINGVDAILLDVVYKEPSLNDALADAIVAINADTGDIIQTADGEDYFMWLTESGTMSETASDQIYKIQYRVITDSEAASSAESERARSEEMEMDLGFVEHRQTHVLLAAGGVPGGRRRRGRKHENDHKKKRIKEGRSE